MMARRHIPASCKWFIWWIPAGFLILLWLGGVSTSCNNRKSQDTSFFLNLHDTVNYVGMQTCMGCHSDKHSTFVHTGMGQSFDSATEQKSKGLFAGIKPIYDTKRDLYYFPFWKNDQLFLQEYRLDGKDTVHARVEKISYIIGSGQHTNSHFWMDGGYVYQAPLTFYTQKGKWDLPPGFEATNTSFTRKIDQECMSCHNGLPQIKTGSTNFFEKIPRGIDCERCHGPGELHVNQKRNGQIVDVTKQADRSIVNPKRLPYTLQVDICQRCHLQGNNVLKPGKTFADFRPGMKLSDVFEVYMPVYENNQKFVMAGHAEQFQKSQCFIQSNKGNVEMYNPKINFTCINCHNPHVSVKQTKIAQFNTTCVQCHSPSGNRSRFKGCTLPINRQIHKNGCVGCHMPASGAEDIPHVMVHDHRIQRPSNIKPSAAGKIPIDLYAVNQSNPQPKMLIKAYLSYFEKFESHPIFLQKAEKLLNQGDVEDQIHFYALKQQWKKVIEISKQYEGSGNVWTSYRIAKAYDQLNELDKACDWYQKVVEVMPYHPDFVAEYANSLIRQAVISGKGEPHAVAHHSSFIHAKKLLENQVKLSQKQGLIWLNLGTIYLYENQFNATKSAYLKALMYNPDHANTLLALATFYQRMGELVLAKEYALKLVQKHPSNIDAQKLLKQLQ